MRKRKGSKQDLSIVPYHWVDSMLVLRTVLAYVPLSFANETTCKFGPSYKRIKTSTKSNFSFFFNTEQ